MFWSFVYLRNIYGNSSFKFLRKMTVHSHLIFVVKMRLSDSTENLHFLIFTLWFI